MTAVVVSLPSLITTFSILRILGRVDLGRHCTCASVRLCLSGLPPWSLYWSSEWVVCSKRGALETLYQHVHTHKHTQRETGNHTNAAQQRVEQAGAFFQMCDINLVDPKHEPVAPTHSSQLCGCFQSHELMYLLVNIGDSKNTKNSVSFS